MGRKISNAGVLCRLLVVTGLFVVVLPGSSWGAEENAAKPREVAAMVNGEPVYVDQLDSRVDARLASYRKFGMREKRPDLVRRLQRSALDQVVEEKLIQQASGKLAIDDIEAKVDQKVKALEMKHGTGERIEKYLKMRNLTMEGLRESYKRRIRIDAYLKQQGVAEPEIPEEQIRAAYDRDPDSFSREESIRVSHILIGVDPHATAEEKKQAREKAEGIRKEILAGKDFAEMAKTHSSCNSASGGGALRPIKRGYMPKEFDEAAFALEKDAVSEVVETKFGYHVIKLTDRQPAGVVPYEEVKDFIKTYLQEEESKKKLAEHIAELKKNAKIEILLPE